MLLRSPIMRYRSATDVEPVWLSRSKTCNGTSFGPTIEYERRKPLEKGTIFGSANGSGVPPNERDISRSRSLSSAYSTVQYQLNGSTGALKWSFTTGDYVCSSPAIGSDGTVYVGSCDCKVYALTTLCEEGNTRTKHLAFVRFVRSSSIVQMDPALLFHVQIKNTAQSALCQLNLAIRAKKAPSRTCIRPMNVLTWPDMSEFFYCPNGSSIPVPCSSDEYCPAGSSSPQPCNSCNAGSYQNLSFVQYECTQRNLACVTCPQFFYCPNGSTTPTPCSSQEYCPAGSASPQPCNVACPIQLFKTSTCSCVSWPACSIPKLLAWHLPF